MACPRFYGVRPPAPQALQALYSAVLVTGATAPLPELVQQLLALPNPTALQRQVGVGCERIPV